MRIIKTRKSLVKKLAAKTAKALFNRLNPWNPKLIKFYFSDNSK